MTAPRFINKGDVLPNSFFVNYIVGKWYSSPFWTLVTGSATVANTIRALPHVIEQTCTISALQSRITTLSAAGNVQFAVYANDPATMRPTGNPLASTSSMSTGSTGLVSSAAVVQLTPGIYWFCSNCDNSTAVFGSVSAATTWVGSILGSATAGNALGNNTTVNSVTAAQTFGSWPDLTAASWSENTQPNVPFIEFQIGSLP